MNKDKHIPQGYKDSPLGIIPKEWEVKRLGEVCSKITDGTHDTPQKQDVGVPYLTAIHVKDGVIDYDNCYFLTQEDHNEIYQRCNPEFGDVLMVNIGAGVGAVAMNKVEYEFSLKNVALLKPNKEILTGYFLESYLLASKRKNIHRLLNGGAQPFFGLDDIARIHILLPSLIEQNRLESIISLWDTAIKKQSELIEKLKLRKRALMQQLLTGKKHLPGFSGEWKEVKLGDVFDERNETNRDDLPLLSITGDKGVIYQSDSDKRDISNDDKSKYKRICPNDIGYNTMRMWQGRSALSELEGIVSPAYTIVTPRENVNVRFMAMLIQQPRVVYDFWTHSQGLVSDTLNCKYPDFSQVKVRIPTKQEQTAIAFVLVKADKEIELANEKLASLQSQKRGLMQQLLTGKKRIK